MIDPFMVFCAVLIVGMLAGMVGIDILRKLQKGGWSMGSTLELYVTVENGNLDQIKTSLNTAIYNSRDTTGYRFNKATAYDNKDNRYDVLFLDCDVRWDYNPFFNEVSKLFPAAVISLEIWPEETYFNDITRVYFCNGMSHEVRAEIVFPPHSFVPPNKEYRTVNVVVMGREVPVEIECYSITTDEEAYQIAKNILKSTL